MGGQLYNQPVDWDKHIETLKTMWAAGNSASQIAAVIPDASRSAVLGKIMRLKLPARDKGHVRGPPRPRRFNGSADAMTAAPRSPRPRHNITRLQATANGHDKAPKPTDENWPHRRTAETNRAERIEIADEPLPPILRGEAPDGTGIKFAELRVGVCRWPRGDPAEPDFEFCGGKSLPDQPYCARHSRLAYAPPKARAAADNWALHRADTRS